MLPCEEVRKLAEEYVSETLEAPQRAEVARHLRVCQSCHRMMEEARLARRVLDEASAPPPPPKLAERIKAAGRLRLNHRPRPLHERALGSPAFLATCASLLCGAIICLVAIAKVAYVQPGAEPPAPTVTVVESFRLPAREVPRVAVRNAIRPSVRTARGPVERRRSFSLVSVPYRQAVRTRPVGTMPASTRVSRASMATVKPTPAMSLSPHLPAPTVTLAGVRISRPDAVTGTPGAEPAGRERDERLDLAPAALDAPARTDFTSARQ
ncbi:zf-HC2 domain-containing protein [bacterium]|nr:zf-HC2 domain-containing protein [bacterium]